MRAKISDEARLRDDVDLGKQEEKRTHPVSSSSALVPMKEVQGCLHWEILLIKKDASKKFGFSYANRRDLDVEGHESNELDALEVLIIRSVNDDGLLSDWNVKHPDEMVQVGDRIVEINGTRTVYDMKEELRCSQTISMRFCRFPASFEVELVKTEAITKFGFRFEKPSPTNPFVDSIHLLRIADVGNGGALHAWNTRQFLGGHYHLVVTAGMCIEAANDSEGDAEKLAEELRTSSTLRLRVRRRPK